MSQPLFLTPPPSEADRRALPLVRRLMEVVNHRFGFRIGDQVEKRLMRVAREQGFEELARRVLLLERLKDSDAEWQDLVEQITVHETYFFREREQLDLLIERHLRPLLERRRREGRRELKIWSAGCSSGEEVYSLAVLMLEELIRLGEARELDGQVRLLSPWRIELIGTDISRPALAQARRGVYREGMMSSFRDTPRHLMRYFEPVPRAESEDADADAMSWGPLRRVRQDARALARFELRNLHGAGPAVGGCDVVLCRNVLIYFDDASRRAVVDQLSAALAPGGALVLGATDYVAGDGRMVIERNDQASFLRLPERSLRT